MRLTCCAYISPVCSSQLAALMSYVQLCPKHVSHISADRLISMEIAHCMSSTSTMPHSIYAMRKWNKTLGWRGHFLWKHIFSCWDESLEMYVQHVHALYPCCLARLWTESFFVLEATLMSVTTSELKLESVVNRASQVKHSRTHFILTCWFQNRHKLNKKKKGISWKKDSNKAMTTVCNLLQGNVSLLVPAKVGHT